MLEDRENINQAEERLLRELQSIELIGEIDFSYKDVEKINNRMLASTPLYFLVIFNAS